MIGLWPEQLKTNMEAFQETMAVLRRSFADASQRLEVLGNEYSIRYAWQKNIVSPLIGPR
jgi:hypothetical protein